MKRLLPLLAGFALVSCDSGTRHTEGTSSETQTALQALADSLLGIRLPQDGPGASTLSLAARSAVADDSSDSIPPGGPWTPRAWVNRNHAYYVEGGGRNAYHSWTHSRVRADTMWIEDTTRFIRPDLDITYYRRSYQSGDHTSRTVLDTSYIGVGLTRSGFAFKVRRMSDLDRNELPLDALGIPPSLLRMGYVYRFRSGWSMVAFEWTSESFRLFMSEDFHQRLPIFHEGRHEGWLENAEEGTFLGGPIVDFTRWRIRGLDGRVYQRRELARLENWVGDSMGVFFGTPRLDPAGTSLLIPYRWRFFPGTIAATERAGGRMNEPFLGVPWFEGSGFDSTLRAEGFDLRADAGDSVAILRGVVTNGRLAPLRVTTGWFSRGDSGSIDALDFFLDVPEMSIGSAAISSEKVAP